MTSIREEDWKRELETSVLRTAEIFAMTKRSCLGGYDYEDCKRVKVHTKLNDIALKIPQKLVDYAEKGTHKKNQPQDEMHLSSKEDLEQEKNTDDKESRSISFIDTVSEEMEEKRKQSIAPKSSKPGTATALMEYKKSCSTKETSALITSHSGSIVRRHATKVPKPKWHAPWKLKRVIAGHLGWVRAIAVDPTNDWFVTGAADRTIKVWDLASGQLRLTLTGHINAIRGLEVSSRHPYLFSAAEDKKVLCWDLEYNKVIRSYHGHLSGVFSLKLHPTLDILITGGRDAVARVWDMRSKQQIHVLAGHQGTVWSLETQATDPQVLTGSSDSMIKLWDLAAGKVMTTLTHHKKAIRTLVKSPINHTFFSGAADNVKKWGCKQGQFLRNFSGHNAIINALAINQDGVLVSSADNGSIHFWDCQTGYCFQKEVTKVQPGSLDSEAGIYASIFDKTGLRFITCEADKTIKVWHEDPEATEESHPIDMAQWTKNFTAPKRY